MVSRPLRERSRSKVGVARRRSRSSNTQIPRGMTSCPTTRLDWGILRRFAPQDDDVGWCARPAHEGRGGDRAPKRRTRAPLSLHGRGAGGEGGGEKGPGYGEEMNGQRLGGRGRGWGKHWR